MLKHRIIPCVLLKNWQLVKSIQFRDFRTIGHPISTVRIYNARNVDELIVLDIDASINNEEINLELIRDMSDECFMPLTIGGGIRTIENIYQVLNAGADKIAINTEALENPDFIRQASNIFGSQCIVVSIDVKRTEEGQYKIYNKKLGEIERDPFHWAKECESLGAGEILLTSIDNEGLQNGYDLELLSEMVKFVRIPIIINGGCGIPQHCSEAIMSGADAVAASSIFHFSQFTPNDIKRSMSEDHLPVRLLL